MFYSTTIKSIGNTGVVDTQGRYLRFIGNLPAKEGDTVYTDGKYIFGNAPPKGSPAIFDETSGIPVLGDEDASGEEELRGYFTTSGKYKRYRVKGDEWITNAEKTYAHDGSFEGIDDDNIIDAEIALDKNGAEDGVYTVEKIITDIVAPNAESYDEAYYYVKRNIHYDDRLTRSICKDKIKNTQQANLTLNNDTAEYIMRDEITLKKCELIIRKDGKELDRINLSDLVKDFEEEAKNYVRVSTPYHEPEDYIKSRAVVHNFKILPDGNWVAIIETEIITERGLYNDKLDYVKTTDGDIQQVGSRMGHDEALELAIAMLANWGLSDIVGTSGSESGASQLPWVTEIRGWVDYYDYFVVKGDYQNIFIHMNVTFKITSDATIEKIFWSRDIPSFHIKDAKIIDADTNPSPINEADERGYFTEQLVSKHTAKGEANAMQALIGGQIPLAIADGSKYSDDKFLIITYHYDSDNLPEYEGRFSNEYVEDFTFPVQDDYQAKMQLQATSHATYWAWLLGVYDEKGKKVVGEIKPNYGRLDSWNMSIVSLKDGGYLFGIHADPDNEISGAGKLYKVDTKGNLEQVGDGVKNFRLREMKKISKAKR